MIKILKDGVNTREEIFSVVEPKVNVEKIVEEIIENVKTNGDKALYEYALKFDKAEIKDLAVSKQEIDEAVKSCDKEFLSVLQKAKQNIYAFHQNNIEKALKLKKKMV